MTTLISALSGIFNHPHPRTASIDGSSSLTEKTTRIRTNSDFSSKSIVPPAQKKTKQGQTEGLDNRAPNNNAQYINNIISEVTQKLGSIEEANENIDMIQPHNKVSRTSSNEKITGGGGANQKKAVSVKVQKIIANSTTVPNVFVKRVQYGNNRGRDANGLPYKDIAYKTLEIQGSGSFGLVLKAKTLHNGEIVALKKIIQNKKFKNRELHMLRLLDHPNIISLKYFFVEPIDNDESYLNLIFEFVPLSLYQRIRQVATTTSSVQPSHKLEFKCYMWQIFKALDYLHNEVNICHRDIKPQNILIDQRQVT